MKSLIMLTLLLFAARGYADASEPAKCIPPPPKPKVVYVPTPPPPKPKVIYVPTPPPKEPCCQKPTTQDSKNEITAPNAASSTSASGPQTTSTGPQTQTVTINMPTTRTFYHPQRKASTTKTTIYHLYNLNRLQLLLGLSKTKLNIEEDSCCNYRATRKYENDLGIQYLRDFGPFTGSIVGTMNQNMYLGFGVNW